MNLEQLYRIHSNLVYNLAFKYMLNQQDAEEITQDVFIKVNSKMADFKHEADIKTWIFRITTNTCLDAIKAKNRNKRRVYKNSLNTDDVVVANTETPNSILVGKENLSILLNCVSELPDNQKNAFLLSKQDGLSNKEIADILMVSISSIESLIFRAKKNLKVAIENKWPEYRKTPNNKSSKT